MLAYQRLLICALLVTMGMLDPAAGAPLNPRVRLLSHPSSKPPAECEEGLAPATTNQIEPAVAPQSALEPPPRSDLRSRLAEAQESAQRGLRPELIDAVEQLKMMLASYPAGAERDAANAVVHVYDDTLRLWTYEFDNPAGGFFDASTEEGAILQMLSAYPEFGRFIAPLTLNAGGITVYPTREARGFLVAEAARRMRRIAGVPVTSPDQAPRAATPDTRSKSKSPAAMPRASGTPAPSSSASPGPAKRSSAASSPQHRKSSSAASAATGSTGKKKGGGGRRVHVTHPKKKNKEESTATMAAASKSSDHRPAANTSPAASTPASKAGSEKPARSSSSTVKRAAHDPSTASYPAPAPPSPPVGLPSGSPVTSSSAGSAKGRFPPSSSATAAPVPTPPAETSTNGVTTSAEPASGTSTGPGAMTSSSTGSGRNPAGSETVGAGDVAEPSVPAERRNMIIPIVLILVGLGVLLLLFRASK